MGSTQPNIGSDDASCAWADTALFASCALASGRFLSTRLEKEAKEEKEDDAQPEEEEAEEVEAEEKKQKKQVKKKKLNVSPISACSGCVWAVYVDPKWAQRSPPRCINGPEHVKDGRKLTGDKKCKLRILVKIKEQEEEEE